MKLLTGAGAVVVAAGVASFVVAGLALSVLDVVDGAGFYALAVVAFPLFIAWGAWKHGSRY